MFSADLGQGSLSVFKLILGRNGVDSLPSMKYRSKPGRDAVGTVKGREWYGGTKEDSDVQGGRLKTRFVGLELLIL